MSVRQVKTAWGQLCPMHEKILFYHILFFCSASWKDLTLSCRDGFTGRGGQGLGMVSLLSLPGILSQCSMCCNVRNWDVTWPGASLSLPPPCPCCIQPAMCKRFPYITSIPKSLDSPEVCFYVPKRQLIGHGWRGSKSQVFHANTRCLSALQQLWMPKDPQFLPSDRISRSWKHRKYYKSTAVWQALSQSNCVLKGRIFLGERRVGVLISENASSTKKL